MYFLRLKKNPSNSKSFLFLKSILKIAETFFSLTKARTWLRYVGLQKTSRRKGNFFITVSMSVRRLISISWSIFLRKRFSELEFEKMFIWYSQKSLVICLKIMFDKLVLYAKRILEDERVFVPCDARITNSIHPIFLTCSWFIAIGKIESVVCVSQKKRIYSNDNMCLACRVHHNCLYFVSTTAFSYTKVGCAIHPTEQIYKKKDTLDLDLSGNFFFAEFVASDINLIHIFND